MQNVFATLTPYKLMGVMIAIPVQEEVLYPFSSSGTSIPEEISFVFFFC